MSWSPVICPWNLFSTSFSLFLGFTSCSTEAQHSLNPERTILSTRVALPTLNAGASASYPKGLVCAPLPSAPQWSIFFPLPGFDGTSPTPVCSCLAAGIPLKSTSALCASLFLLLLSAS